VVGWHYDWSQTFEGTFWRDGTLRHALRKYDDSRTAGVLDPEHVANMRGAPWFTGRVFGAIGTRRILCFNGSFFVVRRAVWERIGGFDERLYPGHWADDFFEYAVLDQGFDVANLPAVYRCGAKPDSFHALTDLEWQGKRDPYRGRDCVDWKPSREVQGLGAAECALLDMIERRLGDDARVAVVAADGRNDGGSGGAARVPASVPWTPRRGVRADGAPADLVLAPAGADMAKLRALLRPGGTAVVFGEPAGGANGAVGVGRAGTLTVAYADAEERRRFARLPSTSAGAEGAEHDAERLGTSR
jgi:hypothetical protein